VRVLWMLSGLVALGLAALGAALPVLPATPFLLLAAAAFARSSPRLHRWLLTHPRLGPVIADWRAHGAIGLRARILALAAMAATLALSLQAGIAAGVLAVQCAVMLAAALFLLTRPLPPRRTATHRLHLARSTEG